MAVQTLLAANGIVSRSEDQPTVRLRMPGTSVGPGSSNDAAQAPLEAVARSFENFLDRQDAPEFDAMENWCAGFSGHREHARFFCDLHRHDPDAARRLARAMTNMPPAGSEFLGFHLLSELGRGAFGRAYLAEQENLARRRVVVKIAADVWGEARLLAQLQHPNIVPVYSVHQREDHQVVCMPFCGSATLQHVLDEVRARAGVPVTGNALLSTFRLGTTDGGATESSHDASHAQYATVLAKLSYVEAIVLLGVQMADALAHAHEHGIVHRDLKPANVLLSDDGRPLLLDFNVAEDTKQSTGAALAWIAGTLPYMAPEQLANFAGVPEPVDGRCDIYALGIILHELLTGRHPFPCPNRRPLPGMVDHIFRERTDTELNLRRWNRAVSPALNAIVVRCLATAPQERYQSAHELYEDLQRQHTHLPLLHTPEPSRRERVRKWARRQPRLLVGSLVLCGLLLVIAALTTFTAVHGKQLERLRLQEANRIRQEQRRSDAEKVWKRFRANLKTAQFLLYTRTNEPEQLDQGIALGQRLLALYGVLDDAAWRETPLVQSLAEDEQASLSESMGELLRLLARAQMQRRRDRPGAATAEATLVQALLMNERAAACDPRSAASPGLWRQRAELCALLGRAEAAEDARSKAETLPLQSAQDHYWLASERIAAGKLREALPLLQQATRLEPDNFWAWFVLANGYDRLGQDRRAEGCYGACIALAPRFAWSHFNRGLAFLRQQDYQLACADFDEVIRQQPNDADAYLNRALAHQGLRELQQAEDDLSQALERGGPATRLYFLRARVRELRGDKDGARSDFEEGLRRPPSDEKSWLARGFANLSRDPKAALADFDEALRINPRSAGGLQNKAHVLAEKLGRNQDALEVLNQSVELYPDSPQVRGGRGVLLARLGQRDAALRDAEETLARDASPSRQYQVACIYALTTPNHSDDRLQALQLLSAALRSGYGHQLLETDRDLNALRDLPEFRRLIDAARTLRVTPPDSQAKIAH